MCCLATTLVFFGPRLAILVWWLIAPIYVGAAFDQWFFTILAWLFIPWTVLMYLIIYPGGIVGFDWVLLVLGILADIGSYSGGFWGNRKQIPGYSD